jgi:hypothetical protein
LHRCIVSICKCQTSSLLPSIYPLPSPFLLPPSSFQNTHARRFERAKSIERCQRARGLEDSRDVSDRTLFFLPSSFLIFLYSLLLFFFFFMSSLLVKSDMEKTSCWRKDQDEKKKKSEDTFKMSVRERRDCVCVCCAIHGDATVAISLYSPSPSSTQQPPHPPFSLPPPLSRSTYEQRRSGTHHPSAVRIFHPHPPTIASPKY